MSRPSATDRRVRRTEKHLGDALVGLLHEKPYESIAVKEILARANVGRSTFYAHFSGKDELLASEIRNMLGLSATHAPEPASRAERVLAFARPILERIDRDRVRSSAAVGQEQHTVHGQVERLIAELVAVELKRLGMSADVAGSTLPRDLLARHVAATFVRMLAWWGESGHAVSAADVERRFRALVVPVLEEALGTS
ncbi:MAG: helix-turn-helix domain-containing protein [Gemmatimonadaceae bacterium]